MPGATYIFADPSDHAGYRGSITDALTGRETAIFDGFPGRVVVGEPLCSGCDAPIRDGTCGCGIEWGREVKRERKAA
jgi:hypothetical protein